MSLDVKSSSVLTRNNMGNDACRREDRALAQEGVK